MSLSIRRLFLMACRTDWSVKREKRNNDKSLSSIIISEFKRGAEFIRRHLTFTQSKSIILSKGQGLTHIHRAGLSKPRLIYAVHVYLTKLAVVYSLFVLTQSSPGWVHDANYFGFSWHVLKDINNDILCFAANKLGVCDSCKVK